MKFKLCSRCILYYPQIVSSVTNDDYELNNILMSCGKDKKYDVVNKIIDAYIIYSRKQKRIDDVKDLFKEWCEIHRLNYNCSLCGYNIYEHKTEIEQDINNLFIIICSFEESLNVIKSLYDICENILNEYTIIDAFIKSCKNNLDISKYLFLKIQDENKKNIIKNAFIITCETDNYLTLKWLYILLTTFYSIQDICLILEEASYNIKQIEVFDWIYNQSKILGYALNINTKIKKSIEENNLDLFKYFIKLDNNCSFTDDLLQITVQNNNLEFFQYLLNLNKNFKIDSKLLRVAIKNNNLEFAKCIYSASNNLCNIYEIFYENITTENLLYCACYTTNYEMLEWLYNQSINLGKPLDIYERFDNFCGTFKNAFTACFNKDHQDKEYKIAKLIYDKSIKDNISMGDSFKMAFLNCVDNNLLDAAKWLYNINPILIDKNTLERSFTLNINFAEFVISIDKTVLNLNNISNVLLNCCRNKSENIVDKMKWLYRICIINSVHMDNLNLKELYRTASYCMNFPVCKWLLELSEFLNKPIK